ncbi:MAG: Plug domain-containing protein [Sedimentisphaerales bacterium]|jgi:outer membrane receptor for ferrienterochelin and colicin
MRKGKKELKTVLLVSHTDDTNGFMSTDPVTGETPHLDSTFMKTRENQAAVTTVTAEQIKASGARSLFELLDIYVPNLQVIRHHWESDHIGLRGIINDRDDKYLLLVNGKVINERMVTCR